MIKTVMKTDGMMCGMCESHINDAVRAAFNVKKVTSSHSKGETVILSENELDVGILTEAVSRLGYRVISVTSEICEKKSFSLFRKR